MWKQYRRTVELFQALFLTGLPFLGINGQSALRFDIGELKLNVFGTVIWIREFYLLLVVVLFFLLLITFVTAIFGRIWCGWLCPQTILLDLSGTLATHSGLKNRKAAQKVLLLPLSALMALTMIFYFVTPLEALGSLFRSLPVTAFFLTLWTTIYLELAFLGRKFCISICPYGMMQNALFDKDTLLIEYDRSREASCMKCDACVKVCPVGIDIKNGLSGRCIACAECIDACRNISEPRGMAPFPDYKGNIVRPKTFWMGGLTAATGMALLLLIFFRPPVDFFVTRNQETLPEGLNRYSWSVYNNSNKQLDLELSANPDVTIIGKQTLRVEPFSVIRGKLLLKSEKNREQVCFTLSGDTVTIKRKAGFL